MSYFELIYPNILAEAALFTPGADISDKGKLPLDQGILKAILECLVSSRT